MAAAREPVERLIIRANAAFERRGRWNQVLQDAYDYALPNRNTITRQSEGAPRVDHVFDSTALHSVARFAGRMQSGLTPPFERWCELKAGPLVPEGDRQDADRALAPITEAMFAVFNAGNFNAAIHEFYLDLAVGDGVLLVLESDDAEIVRFVPVPAAQVAFEEGAWGKVGAVFRKHPIKARLITASWPDAKLPDDLARREQDTTVDSEVELIECCYQQGPREPWIYQVVWGDQKHVLVDREYRESPFVVCRWMKAPGETHGRGPVLNALPDIKTANKAVEMILKAAALALSGVYTVADDDVTNPDTIRIAPHAMIQVARNGGANGPSIQPLTTGRDFDLGMLVLEDQRMNIKKHLLDQQLPPDAGPVRSATEIVERVKELSQDAGSAFGRLMNELLVPLVRRVLEIMERKGIVAMPAGGVDQLFVKLSVISPLARAQRLADVETVLQWLSIMVQFGGVEAMALAAKVELVFTWVAEMLGVPADLVRSEAEKKGLQEQVAALMMAQRQGMGAGAAAGPAQQPAGPMARAA